MNDKDKIQINAYLDGELNANEVKEIEKLINTDESAKEYLNNLKMINNELTAEAKSELDTNSYKASREFVETEIIPKIKTKPIKFFSFFENLAYRNLLAYSLIAVVFFNVGVVNSPQDTDAPINLLYDFDALTTLEKDFPKFRSEEDQELEILILQTIEEMVNNKILNSRLIWGGNTYFISIKEAYLSMSKTTCYEAELFERGEIKEFMYCKNETDKSIIFSD